MHELIENGAVYNITTTRQIGGMLTVRVESVFVDVNGHPLAIRDKNGTIWNWINIISLTKIIDTVSNQQTGVSTNGNRRMSAL